MNNDSEKPVLRPCKNCSKAFYFKEGESLCGPCEKYQDEPTDLEQVLGTNRQSVVWKAREFARWKHAEQKDDEGLPYFSAHLNVVANLIMLIAPDDPNLMAAAFLHDTIEDTKTTEEELRGVFGDDITDLVMEVTHEGNKDREGYYFPRLKTQRGIILKFADRLSNLSRMTAWDDRRQHQYLKKSKFWSDGFYVQRVEWAKSVGIQTVDHGGRISIIQSISDPKEITEEYLERFRKWLIENEKEYFKYMKTSSQRDFEYFDKSVRRSELVLNGGVMMIDRDWKGEHCYTVTKVTANRVSDLAKVIKVRDLKHWRNGYFLFPKFKKDER